MGLYKTIVICRDEKILRNIRSCEVNTARVKRIKITQQDYPLERGILYCPLSLSNGILGRLKKFKSQVKVREY